MIIAVKLLLISFLAPMSLGILYNAKKERLFYIGLTGLIGYSLYMYSNYILYNVILATFIGSFTIGVVSEVFARMFKVPAIVYSIPGIVSMVPGYSAYTTATYLIDKNASAAFDKGFQTISVAGAIAVGVMLGTALFVIFGNVLKFMRSKKLRRKQKRTIARRS